MVKSEDNAYRLDPARKEAAHILTRIFSSSAYANRISVNGDQPSRARTTYLVRAVLRRYRCIDHLIHQAMSKHPSKIDPVVLNILRVAVAEIWDDPTIVFAAVDNAVESSRLLGKKRAAPFINGVLRGLLRLHHADTWQTVADKLPAAERFNISDDLWHDAVSGLGEGAAHEIIGAMQNTPIFNVTRMTSNQTTSPWDEAKVNPTMTDVRDVSSLSLWQKDLKDGTLMVQSEASRIAVLALGLDSDAQFSDLCAAPGGKTRLAHHLHPGIRIEAVDISENKLGLLSKYVTSSNVRTVIKDVQSWSAPAGTTHVLLDVPCTGTGTLSHKPDLRHRYTTHRLEELLDLQRALLHHVVGQLPQGCIFVYATCSILYQENEAQIDWVRKQHSTIEVIPMPQSVPASVVTPESYARINPNPFRTSGGFAARLIKR